MTDMNLTQAFCNDDNDNSVIRLCFASSTKWSRLQVTSKKSFIGELEHCRIGASFGRSCRSSETS